jgi:pimeloyl-ACP methyl ester carboxylesterase
MSSMSMAARPTDLVGALGFFGFRDLEIGHVHVHARDRATQFVEANGIRFAYRRFGNAGGVPLVFNQHYTGTMDYWDPAVTDGLARDREVILFNNAGVSSSSGEVPNTFEQMGANAIAFTRALGLNKADVLGFSIGGMVAQELALQAPDLVRKLILVGTGPRGGEGMETLTKWPRASSAPPTIRPSICGSPCSSVLPRRAKRRDWSS